MISTHTLTWSVTKHPLLGAESETISTHTLTWSVTKSYHVVLKIILISTHTLTWSVTFFKQALQVFVADFNSHAHVERDT